MYKKYLSSALMYKKFLILTVNISAVCFLSVFSVIRSAAQSPMQVALQDQFDAYRKIVLQEKIFLHSDKNFYLAGEICWFKIYNVDAFFHKPLGISKVAYVEVLDRNNKPVLQAKIALKEGDGNGSFFLPVTMNSEKYKLRAYTNWMKNFRPDYFFEKTITVINSRKIYEGDTLRRKEGYDAHFFPEGGNLVNGIKSKIAFKITGQNGKGIDCEGAIINENADTVVKYRTLKFGMGSFELTPEAGHAYKALITLRDGKSITQVLPAAYNYGYVMRLSEADTNRIKITVQAPANNSPYLLYLFAHTRGSVKSVMNVKSQDGNAEFFIDKNKLGDGISHFTVFNAEKQPVCERLYFKYPEQRLEMQLTADKEQYEQRKKINIRIHSFNQEGKSVHANMSMAVYRVDSLQELDDINISNYLLLSSDLAGSIESPGYYFNNTEEDKEQAMDNLMLTHGWRRFRWEDVLENKKPAFAFTPEYTGHIVTGRIIKTRTALPEKKIGSYLAVPGTRMQFRTSVSDSNGHVKFEMKDFYNKGEIIVQTNSRQDSGYTVEISNPFTEKYSNRPLPDFSLSQVNAAALENYHAAVQVQNVYSGNKLKQFNLPPVDTSAFYFKPDIAYLPDNYVRFTTMEEVLREYVMPVNVRKKNGKFHLPVLDVLRKQPFDLDPMILLDGVPVFDIDKLMMYDPLKIRKLEVVSRMYYFGNMYFPGIVNFVTYTGNLPGYELDPNATVIDYEGLQLQREFFSPAYETPEEFNSRLPDFRNLLFWSPEIKTDEKGKQAVSFFSSDLPGKYAVVLQGLTADGKAGSKTILFEVKDK
jgi:hypothetical protein